METTTTTTLTLTEPPRRCTQVSTCPHCGAPIYIDADLRRDEKVVVGLPTTWYTCACRFAAQPVPVAPMVFPQPTNPEPWPQPTWQPFPNTIPWGPNTSNVWVYTTTTTTKFT